MAFGDIFKGKQYKNEIDTLTAEIERLSRLMTPEMKEIENQRSLLMNISSQKEILKDEITSLNIKRQQIQSELSALDEKIKSQKNEIIQLDDEILYQSFGIYSPVYNLVSSEGYKNKIEFIRQEQKNMIKDDIACSYSTNMKLDDSLKKGQKMVKDNVKQALRTFNNECEMLISKVKFNNIDSIRSRIVKSKESLEKLNSALGIRINNKYLDLKLEELSLCHEYALKKQEEKEQGKEERERLREEAKLQKEIEESRKSLTKEQSHYNNALEKLETQIKECSDKDTDQLIKKRDEMLSKLSEVKKAIQDVDYREANKRAGYVYIISNIGSFGEDIYKIGMTRRLEPLDRVNELGDASVPFNFDVHAMIFSDDAPSLENALHKAFEHKKVNMVNQRREFFNATLSEIKEVVSKNFDKTVDFVKTPEAEQYRESIMLKKDL